MIVEVKTVDIGEEGRPEPAFVLVIEDQGQWGCKAVLSLTERVQLAKALIDSLPDQKNAEMRAVLETAWSSVEEYQDLNERWEDSQAMNRALHAARNAGATDKETARTMINRALGRPPGDRTNLSPEEWNRATENLREMSKGD